MKRLIVFIVVLCLAAAVFTACIRRKDRADDNGMVTDDTAKKTELADTTTVGKNGNSTSKNTDDKNIVDDAGDAVSDAVRGATDAVDDILGGRDTTN